MSVCLSRWSFKSNCFVSRWNRAIFWLSSLHVALYNTLLFDFWFRPPNTQNLLPKICNCTKSPISRLAWQIDRRCLGLLGGFQWWPIQWNHAKCCGADPCCHGNNIWPRRGDLFAYRLVYLLTIHLVFQVCICVNVVCIFLSQVEFIRGLVLLVTNKMELDITELLSSDVLFAHLIDETLTFHHDLHSVYSYPAPLHSCLHVLIQPEPFHKWKTIEQKCKQSMLDNCKWFWPVAYLEIFSKLLRF